MEGCGGREKKDTEQEGKVRGSRRNGESWADSQLSHEGERGQSNGHISGGVCVRVCVRERVRRSVCVCLCERHRLEIKGGGKENTEEEDVVVEEEETSGAQRQRGGLV